MLSVSTVRVEAKQNLPSGSTLEPELDHFPWSWSWSRWESFCLEPELMLESLQFFCLSSLFSILTTQHSLEYSARRALIDAEGHGETRRCSKNDGVPKNVLFNRIPFPQFLTNDGTLCMCFPTFIYLTDQKSSQTL